MRGREAVLFGAHVDKQYKPRATHTRFRRSKAVSAAQAMTGRFHYGRRSHSARTSVTPARITLVLWRCVTPPSPAIKKGPRIEPRAFSPTPDRSYSDGCLVSGSGTITVSSSRLSAAALPVTGIRPVIGHHNGIWISRMFNFHIRRGLNSGIHQRAKCFSLTFASRLRSLHEFAKLSKLGKFLLIIRNGLLQQTCVGAPEFYGRAA